MQFLAGIPIVDWRYRTSWSDTLNWSLQDPETEWKLLWLFDRQQVGHFFATCGAHAVLSTCVAQRNSFSVEYLGNLRHGMVIKRHFVLIFLVLALRADLVQCGNQNIVCLCNPREFVVTACKGNTNVVCQPVSEPLCLLPLWYILRAGHRVEGIRICVALRKLASPPSQSIFSMLPIVSLKLLREYFSPHRLKTNLSWIVWVWTVYCVCCRTVWVYNLHVDGGRLMLSGEFQLLEIAFVSR